MISTSHDLRPLHITAPPLILILLITLALGCDDPVSPNLVDAGEMTSGESAPGGMSAGEGRALSLARSPSARSPPPLGSAAARSA